MQASIPLVVKLRGTFPPLSRFSDMRAGILAHKTEKMLLLRLNRHLIPGFARVEQKLESLKVKQDAQEAASVAAQNARAGTVVNLS